MIGKKKKNIIFWGKWNGTAVSYVWAMGHNLKTP